MILLMSIRCCDSNLLSCYNYIYKCTRLKNKMPKKREKPEKEKNKTKRKIKNKSKEKDLKIYVKRNKRGLKIDVKKDNREWIWIAISLELILLFGIIYFSITGGLINLGGAPVNVGVQGTPVNVGVQGTPPIETIRVCYQESANTSNQGGRDTINCGLNYGGSYDDGGATTGSPLLRHNGVWSDYGDLQLGKPMQATYIYPSSGSIKSVNNAWLNVTLYHGAKVNYLLSVPLSCIQRSDNKFNWIAEYYKIGTNNYFNISCFTQGGAKILFENGNIHVGDIRFYEESVRWSITSYSCNLSETLCSAECFNLQNNLNNCGSCGNACDGTETCVSGECICTPETCDSLGKSCGTWPDGCEGDLNCGAQIASCTAQFGSCSVSGTKTCSDGQYGSCAATTNPITTNCTGKACGASDGCGGVCSGTNGICPAGQNCNSTGSCVYGISYACTETDGGNLNAIPGNATITANGVVTSFRKDTCAPNNYLHEVFCASPNASSFSYASHLCKIQDGKVCLNNSRGEGYCGDAGCNCGTRVCGTYTNATCSLSCGTCGAGLTCNSTGQCVAVPESFDYVAYYEFNESLSESWWADGSLDLDSTPEVNSSYFKQEDYCDNKYIESTTAKPIVLYRELGDDFQFSGNDKFSISFWTKLYGTTQGSYSNIISKYENYQISAAGNKLVFSVKGESENWISTANYSVPTNKWIFVTAVYNGTKIKLYVNGTKVKETSVTENLASSSGNFVVMADSGDGITDFEEKCTSSSPVLSKSKCRFNGAIDELIILDGALTDSDISTVYNSAEVDSDGYPLGYAKGVDWFYCQAPAPPAGSSFRLSGLVCKDEECTQQSTSFAIGEDIYLTYDVSNDSQNVAIDDDYFSDINVTAVITGPNGQSQREELPAVVSFDIPGNYVMTITATKPDYATRTATKNFLIRSEGTTEAPQITIPQTNAFEEVICNNDGVCDTTNGEDSDNCPEDCPAGEGASKWIIYGLIFLVAAILCALGAIVYLKFGKGKGKKMEEIDANKGNLGAAAPQPAAPTTPPKGPPSVPPRNFQSPVFRPGITQRRI